MFAYRGQPLRSVSNIAWLTARERAVAEYEERPGEPAPEGLRTLHGAAKGVKALGFAEPAFFGAEYAVFITGPSATAAIEGILIHRAQGIRTLTVMPVSAQ